MPTNPLFDRLLAFLAASPASASLPVVDLGFCGAGDHLLIGIGGNRFGIFDRTYYVPGAFARFELWASEDDVESFVDALIAGSPAGRGVCTKVVVTGQIGQDVVAKLRASPAFARLVKDQILAQLREFRQDPYVSFQTLIWMVARGGVPELVDSEYPDDGGSDGYDGNWQFEVMPY